MTFDDDIPRLAENRALQPCREAYGSYHADRCQPLACKAPIFTACRTRIAEAGRVLQLEGPVVKTSATRTCKTCGLEKALNTVNYERLVNRGGHPYYAWRCKACRKLYDRAYRQRRQAVGVA